MPEPSQSTSRSTPAPQNLTAPPLLLCEALGFSPQLLLDDIINIANNSIQDGVNGMEQFLEKWTNDRVANGQSAAEADAIMYEVEQGLVSFQTLLEYHTDVAFDFFEAWSLRNIFMIPNDLPVVLPHQEGLDLTTSAEQEQELMDEIQELRKRLDGQRKLNRVLRQANRAASRQLTRSQKRLDSVSLLAPPSSNALDTITNLPSKFLTMYNSVASLPPLDIAPVVDESALASGKRQWESNKTGYMNWALGRLLVKGEGGEPGTLNPVQGNVAVTNLESATKKIGKTDDIKQALQAVDEVRRDLDTSREQEASYQEEDSRMDESS